MKEAYYFWDSLLRWAFLGSCPIFLFFFPPTHNKLGFDVALMLPKKGKAARMHHTVF